MSTSVAYHSKVRDAAKQETRDLLIASAAAEWAERGFDAPSLDGICARAGLTRGAFYVHFKDREELLVAVMDRIMTGFFEVIIATDEHDGAGHDGAGARDPLEATVDRFTEAVSTGAPILHGFRAFRFHHVLAACARSEELRVKYVALMEEAILRVAKAARRAKRAGAVRTTAKSNDLATMLIAVALGTGVMLDVGIPFDPAGLRRCVLGLIRGASDDG